MSLASDLEQAAIQLVADITGQPIAVVTAIAQAFESVIGQFGGDSAARKTAIAGLEALADAGNAAAVIQLSNWATKAGVNYPHGLEPQSSIADAQAALQRVEAAHPTFLSQVTVPGGKNGDSPVDANGPTLK